MAVSGGNVKDRLRLLYWVRVYGVLVFGPAWAWKACRSEDQHTKGRGGAHRVVPYRLISVPAP